MAKSTTQLKGLVGPSFTYGSLPLDCQLSINFEPIIVESANAKAPYALIGTPGVLHRQFRYNGVIYDHIPTAYPGRIRGMYYTSRGFFTETNGALVVVASESVYEVKLPDNAGICDLRKIGVVSNLTDSVGMVDDGFGLIISDGLNMYRVKLSDSAMTSFGSAAPLQVNSVDMLAGYTLCSGKLDGVPQNSFFWSDPYENDVWNPLSYASAEGTADPITSVKVLGGNVWLLGPRSYEIHQPTGSSKRPFTRVSGSINGIGSAAPGAVASIADKLFFLGAGVSGNVRAYVGSGYSVSRISTDALEAEWATYTNFSDAIGYAYSQEGRTYWVISWLTDNKTYVFCTEANAWHQRATRDITTNAFNRWKISQCVYAYDKIFVGSLEDTKMYSLSSQYLDEDGIPIVRVRRTPHVTSGMSVSMHRSITLDLETGIGSATGQGVDPQIMLRYSSDGGRTWSSELWTTAGRQGEYRTRCKWLGLGIARDRVYEIHVSAPVRWTILGAEIDTEQTHAGI
jgi:hypothetical protein